MEEFVETPGRSKPVRPAKQDRTTMALLLVAGFIAVGGVGFAVGHLTAAPAAAANPTFNRAAFGRGNFPTLAPGQTPNPADFAGGLGRNGGLGGLSSLGGGVTGTVQSVDGSTMTIQLANGSTVTVDLSGSTTYHSETSASSSQVAVGSSVIVQIDTGALASETPNPAASGALSGRTLTAKDVLITNP
jgi:hypothetical protein